MLVSSLIQAFRRASLELFAAVAAALPLSCHIDKTEVCQYLRSDLRILKPVLLVSVDFSTGIKSSVGPFSCLLAIAFPNRVRSIRFFQARFVVLPFRNCIAQDVSSSNILVRWSNTWIHFRSYGGTDLGKQCSGDQHGFLLSRQWLSVSDLPVVFSTQLSISPLC